MNKNESARNCGIQAPTDAVSISKGDLNANKWYLGMYAVLSRSLPASVRRDGSRVDKRPSGHKLTQLEEDEPAQWVISMDTCGAAPRPATVGKIANILLAARSSQPPPSVGKNWPSKFVERRNELRTCFLIR